LDGTFFIVEVYMSDVVDRARVFAVAAHGAVAQQRKYSGEPYWHHLAEVVDTLKYPALACTDAQLAAAWLHDVLEDTAVDPGLITETFGEEITNMVVWLTDTTTLADGNRAKRAAINRARLALAPGAVQTIKIADIISNVRSIAAHDPGFAKVYVPEKSQLLDVLTKADPILQINARALINERMAGLA
jgi:(p)ppGpp synthase/HD superfamily hydrolase